jgi:tetratricopeptide (TPR) repeat protein
MKVPYQLRPLPAAAPAVALLVPGRRAEDVLGLYAVLGLDPLPAVHRVADGLLIKLPQPLEVPLAGVIRLRGLSADLLLPVDAELVPPLLPDEAAALVRERGLVFLPDGRVLEYQPDATVAVSELLQIGDVQRSPWQALHEPPALADDIIEMALDLPGTLPDELLELGGTGIGTEAPDMPDARLPAKVAGKALFSLGKGFAWLGKMLNLPGLAGFGASLLGGAMSLAPRLSEQLLGKQEAVLRNLLRQFREGNIEEALKRALPLGNEPGRGSVPAQDANLPRHDLWYSLMNLLGSRGARGPASVWFGGGNTYYELMQEYRKLADQAAAHGDFRRAAFIYGKLLRDFRSAAVVLARGGLHRDAAILYEQAVGDTLAAARAWEAAGEIDRALKLYLKLGEHALAGDLLRCAGEEERAVAEYQRAAANLVESGGRHYEAGQLMEARAQRPDLALPYYRRGWQARPHGNAVACALRLAGHHAATGAGAPLVALTGEADALLATWDTESAALFYNALARHADQPALASFAGELRDRARIGLARKAVQVGRARHSNVLATLFPAGSPWPLPLVHDAEHALRLPSRRPSPSAAHTLRRIRNSNVRAVHQMPVSKEVFLGLQNGEVLCYRPGTGEILTIGHEPGPILSIGSYGADKYLAVVSAVAEQEYRLSMFALAPRFRLLTSQQRTTDGPVWLCTQVADHSSYTVVVYSGRGFCAYSAPDLVPQGAWQSLGPEDAIAVVMASPVSGSPRGLWIFPIYPSRLEWYQEGETNNWHAPLPWTPAQSDDGLAHPMVHAAWNSGDPLEIAALDTNGALRLSRIRAGTSDTPKTISAWPARGERFEAFARIHGDCLAGVTRKAVHWLQGAAGQLLPTPVRLAHPVAAFVLPATNELLVIEAECSLVRVPIAR